MGAGTSEGYEEESLIVARFATSVRIYIKAVVYKGQQNMETFRINKMSSNMEAINWICAYFQEDHDWISELSLVMQENKSGGIEF